MNNSNTRAFTPLGFVPPNSNLRLRLKPLGVFSRLLSAWLAALLMFGQLAILMNVVAQYPSAPPPGGATFGGLGLLNYEAGRRLEFVSADGTVMAGVEDFIDDTGYGNTRAFVWSEAAGSIPLLLPGHLVSFPRAISADGSVVIGTSEFEQYSGYQWGFVWTSGGGLRDLTLPGGLISQAAAMSADATTVVGYSLGSVNGNQNGRAYRWTDAEGMQDLGTLPGGHYSAATAVSADGSTVVGQSAVLVNGQQQRRRECRIWAPCRAVTTVTRRECLPTARR